MLISLFSLSLFSSFVSLSLSPLSVSLSLCLSPLLSLSLCLCLCLSVFFSLSPLLYLLAGYVGTPPNVTLPPFNDTSVRYIITKFTCSPDGHCSIISHTESVCTGGYLTLTCLRC